MIGHRQLLYSVRESDRKPYLPAALRKRTLDVFHNLFPPTPQHEGFSIPGLAEAHQARYVGICWEKLASEPENAESA